MFLTQRYKMQPSSIQARFTILQSSLPILKWHAANTKVWKRQIQKFNETNLCLASTRKHFPHWDRFKLAWWLQSSQLQVIMMMRWWWWWGRRWLNPPHVSLFSTSPHPFHSHFHQYIFSVDNMHSFTRKYGLSSQTNTFDIWMRNTSQMCRARSSAELIGVLSTVSACGGQVLR